MEEGTRRESSLRGVVAEIADTAAMCRGSLRRDSFTRSVYYATAIILFVTGTIDRENDSLRRIHRRVMDILNLDRVRFVSVPVHFPRAATRGFARVKIDSSLGDLELIEKWGLSNLMTRRGDDLTRRAKR